MYPFLQLKKALLGPKRFASEAVYHVSYAQEPTNTYSIYRRGNESLLYNSCTLLYQIEKSGKNSDHFTLLANQMYLP